MKPTLLLLALVFGLSCQRDESIPGNMSPCVLQLIQGSSQPNSIPVVAIYRYKYQGAYVFLGISDCCDFPNILFDQSCHGICAPSGGFTGGGDFKCPNFYKEATEETLIWKRPQ